MRRIFVLSALLFLLSGCAHEMSLEEAKKVSLSMMDSSSAAPPRRIDDVLRSIEQYKSDPAVLQKNIQLAEMQPSDKDPESLGRFYRARAQAAMLIGRTEQAESDLRTALEYLTAWHDGANGRGTTYKELSDLELQNGNYGSALQTAKEAIEEKLSNSKYAAGPYSSAAKVYLAVGDYANSIAYATKARSEYNAVMADRKANWRGSEASIFDIQATYYQALEQWAPAEKYLRKQIESTKGEQEYINDENKRARVLAGQKLKLSKYLIHQDRLTEAEVVARDALAGILTASGSDNLYSAQALNRLAEIYLLQGRVKDAAMLSGKAYDILHAGKANDNSPAVLLSHYISGKAFLFEGNWNGAFGHFSQITSQKDTQDIFLENYYNDINIGLVLLKTGHVQEAEALFQRKYTALVRQFGENRYDSLETKSLLAVAQFAQGRRSAALGVLRETLPKLTARIGDKKTTKEEERSLRLKIITNAYLDLLFDQSDDGAISDELLTEAFRMTEAATAGSVQKAIVDETLRHLAGTNKELGELIRQYQDVRMQIEVSGDHLSTLLWSEKNEDLTAVVAQLKTKVETLRSAGASLLKEIKNKVPSYDRLVNPTLITADEVRRALQPGEVLISVYPTDTRTYVWAVPYQGAPRMFKANLTEQDIDQTVSLLRKSLDSNPETAGDIPEFDLPAAYGLYEKLLKSSEAVWNGASTLIFVTHGSLSQLPLAVLPTKPYELSPARGALFSNYKEVPWLIKKTALTTTPSLDALVKIRSTSSGKAKRRPYAGFGDPIFNPEQLVQNKLPALANRGMQVRGVRLTGKGSLDNSQISSSQLASLNRLPDTADEIQRVASILGADAENDVFLREKASKGRVKSMDLSDRQVIAFATHALVPGDLDGLDQPALALSSPAIAKDGEDGLLTMKEILKLKLNADWVILSACNTGAADSSGREAVSGLGRAFFYAGTKSILVSMWPVETTSAMKLVTETFRYYKEDGLSRAEALRKSMVRLIESENMFDTATGNKIVSYAHPLFWAPFVVVGDGSGRFVQ